MKQPATGTTDATSATSNVANAALEIVKSPNFVKVAALSLLSLSLVILFYHFPSSFSLSFTSAISAFSSAATSSFYIPPPPSWPANPRRTGIVDENGAMTVEFEIGQFDPNAVDDLTYLKGGREEADVKVRIRRNKYKLCDESKREFIPCLDNGEESMRLNLSGSVQKFEMHCPKEGRGLDCLVPMPKGYRKPIPWPRSRDEVWFGNVPHTRLVEAKGGQNWIALKNDKFIFPEGGTQFIHGADQYLDQISQMVPDIAFGRQTHSVMDIGCGVASFGAFLLQRNVTTLSVAPKDVHENQIQLALERGVPAMIAAFDGILLLEVDRMLRAGGYFVWAAQPVYKHQDYLQEQWKAMLNLTSHICWELVQKEGYIAIWQKPLNNSCYLNRAIRAQPPLCDSNDDPDDVWYVNLRACISLLPENGYGANLTTWPTRLHDPPTRLKSIKMDASISRKELLKAESTYWYEVIDGYIAFMHWKEMNFRNVMDMRAGFGGFAAALHDHQIDCWVMNVVPVSEFNTLPVIYDRGLIGVMHDWCKPFDTYPRTYDLLHAAGLFSAEQKRNKCNISSIMLEMDRMLRPGGVVYVHDVVSVMDELQDIATAMGWTFSLRDTAEGPHSIWKVLVCDKRMALKLRSVGAYPVYFLIDNKFMNGSQEEWRQRKRARKQREKKRLKTKA